jgi:dihydroorotate dehydrogenase electron transfer subunit
LSVFRVATAGKDVIGIEIVYRVIGRGTGLMTLLKSGDGLDIIGPLGHGFEWNRDKRVHVLLGGGTGSACIFMLGEEISKAAKEYGLELNVLLGAVTERDLLLEKEFSTLSGNVLVSTDDGSYGYHGLLTEMLKQAIDSKRIPADCAIYASGPEPMLKALVPICNEYGIPAQVSIERHMMCGIGACLVCVCKVNKKGVLRHRDIESSHVQFVPEEEFGYGLACKDGPVFHIEEIMFGE